MKVEVKNCKESALAKKVTITLNDGLKVVISEDDLVGGLHIMKIGDANDDLTMKLMPKVTNCIGIK